MYRRLAIRCILLIFVLFGACICHGQYGKDFGVWNFPDYEDQVFETSFVSNKLKENLRGDGFKGYFFAGSNDWKDVEKGFYDANGVALRRSDSIYFPTLIIRTALTSFYKWQKTKSTKALSVFNAQIGWLADNFYVCDNKYGFWVFTNKSEPYELQPGWTSAMSQGMGISVCLMAYRVTKDDNFLRIADLALKGFYVPVKNGGFKRNLNGGLWFEEYPTTKPSITLNGFIFGVAGLYNFYQNSKNEDVRALFGDSVETLHDNLDIFKGMFTSYYSLKKPFHYAKDRHHKIHVMQLAWLFEITGNKKFAEVSKHFLELHVSDFKINSQLDFIKIRDISSNGCINCEEYGSSNLFDDNWSWGKYWSAYKNPELVIQLIEKREIKSIILYGFNLQSIMMGMTFYNQDNEVVLKVPKADGLDNISYFKTGKEETYIRKISFQKGTSLEKLKVSFTGATRKKVLALREVQCEISMEDEFKSIQNWIKVNQNL